MDEFEPEDPAGKDATAHETSEGSGPAAPESDPLDRPAGGWGELPARIPVPPSTSSPHGRVRLAIVSLAVLLIAGGVIGGVVAATKGPPVPGAGVAPAAFVVSSTQTTLSQHTADVTFSGSFSAAGQSVPIQGTGTADFDTNAFQADLSFASGSTSFEEHELATAGQVYIGLTIDGANMSVVTGGPQWINVPLPDQNSSSLGAGNVDPIDQLKLLEEKGATVVPLGTSSVDGTTVSGYSVTFSAAEMQQNEQKEIQSLGLTPSETQQAESAAQALGSPTIHVYFDGSGLLRRESVSLGGGTSALSGSVQLDFSNFGTPVNIQAPASSDVIGFAQFEQDAQAYDASHQG